MDFDLPLFSNGPADEIELWADGVERAGSVNGIDL